MSNYIKAIMTIDVYLWSNPYTEDYTETKRIAYEDIKTAISSS